MYEYIAKRRSVRKYTAPLSEEIYDKLINFIDNNLEPLYEDIEYKIIVTGNNEVDTDVSHPVYYKKVEAPTYILFYSKKVKGDKLNAGFILQQIDLFLQSIGAGTCWLGMAAPKIKTVGGMQYIIMLAAGMTEKPLRNNLSKFIRKPLEETGNLLDTIALEDVRLAPSAVNCQPWYYEQEGNTVKVHLRRKLLHKIVLKRYDYIDLGISLYHYVLSLRNRNIPFTIDKSIRTSPIRVKLS